MPLQQQGRIARSVEQIGIDERCLLDLAVAFELLCRLAIEGREVIANGRSPRDLPAAALLWAVGPSGPRRAAEAATSVGRGTPAQSDGVAQRLVVLALLNACVSCSR